jgi:RND superfamily putative drug exporter
VKQARSAVHAVPGSDALVGGATAFLLDVEKASSRDNLVIIPIVLLVVLLVLMVLLRAVTAPLILVATVVLSFGAALGISSLLFKYVFGFAEPTRRSRCSCSCSWSRWASTTTSS